MTKRKDNKGRVLNDGEIQRADGRYCYQYTDAFGKRKSVYSWKLIPSDKTPNGKRKGLSLREKEKEINSSRNAAVSCENITVLELVEKYISQKTGVRHNTQANYNFVVNIIKKEEFGTKHIDKVKLSDAKSWLIKMQQIDGMLISTLFESVFVKLKIVNICWGSSTPKPLEPLPKQ